MAEGVRFVWHNRVFAFLIGLAYYNMFFGISLSILFPVIAKDVLHVGPDVLGIMWAAMGGGSLLGVAMASNLSAPRHQRRILVGGQLLLGAAMIGFAIIPIYWLSLLLLFVLGPGPPRSTSQSNRTSRCSCRTSFGAESWGCGASYIRASGRWGRSSSAPWRQRRRHRCR